MVNIPDKLYFKIGEVATLLDVKTHVLRYWETEFSSLKPVKSRTNQRLYRRKDVETALMIKELLYHQGFTIAGAKQHLDSAQQQPLPFGPAQESPEQLLREVKADLLKIRNHLLS